ncbi:MAG: hypothetical protein DRP59_10780 [Spirochaetes bacterium]|nr:MAG: hypothetical protein DRP59_10780 [Spirochaetota bacterium]
MINFTFSGVTRSELLIYTGSALFFIYFFFRYGKRARIEKAAAAEERKRYVEDHSDLSEAMKTAIVDGTVAEGMTEEQLYVSVGLPKRKKILTVEPASNEVFLYQDKVVYMHMGIVQRWKTHKRILGI